MSEGHPSLWFVCKFCARAFKESRQLVQHKREDHLQQFLEDRRARLRAKQQPSKTVILKDAQPQKIQTSQNITYGDCSVTQAHTNGIEESTGRSRQTKESPKENIHSGPDLRAERVENPHTSDTVARAAVIPNRHRKPCEKSHKNQPEPQEFSTSSSHEFLEASSSKDLDSVPSEIPSCKDSAPAPSKIPLSNGSAETYQEQLGKLPKLVKKSEEELTEKPKQRLKLVITRSGKNNQYSFSVSKNGKNSCRFCRRKFSTSVGLASHLRSHKSAGRMLGNRKLKGSAKNSDAPTVLQHRGELHPGKTYPCPSCPQVFSHPRSRLSHMKTHVNADPIPVQPSLRTGPETLQNSSDNARQDQKGSPDPVISNYQCTFGDTRFSTAMKRNKTLSTNSVIRNGEGNTCGECYKNFATLTSYLLHMRSHTTKRVRKLLVCPVCFKSFTYPCRLRNHMKVAHPTRNEKGPAPATPLKVIESQNNKTAVAKKPKADFACKFCHKKFMNSFHLQIHEKIHTGGRPYRCSVFQTEDKFDQNKPVQVMKKGSGRAQQFQQRLPPVQNVKQTGHPGIRTTISVIKQTLVGGLLQYKCQICGQTYSHRTDVDDHVRYDHGL